MKAFVNLPWGHVELEGETLKLLAANLGQVIELWGVRRCGNCDAADGIFPYYRSPGGYEFFGLECSTCNWRLPFGQTKEGGHLYVKEWEPPYQGGQSQSAPQQPAAASSLPDPNIPF